MAQRKKWQGEWLVEVDENGRVMLPIDPYAPQATHYQVKTIYGREGHIELVPMRVASENELRPEPEPEPEQDPGPVKDFDGTREGEPRKYTPEEAKSLDYQCPYCEAEIGEGCFARPSFTPLTNYPDNPSLVHKRRLNLVTQIGPEV